MGGKGGGGEPQSSRDLSEIAKNLYTQTDPLRQALIGRSSAFLGVPSAPVSAPMASPVGGGVPIFDKAGYDAEIAYQQVYNDAGPIDYNAIRDRFTTFAPPTAAPTAAPTTGLTPQAAAPTPMLDVTQSPMYQSIKNAAETQYGRARQDILASTPAGGALFGNLANLDASKADLLTQQTGALAQDELNRAFSLATGMPAQSISGLGQAGNIQAQMANTQAQRDAAAKGGLGFAAGSFLGGK